MKIVDRGLVFLGKDGSEYSSACFHGACELPEEGRRLGRRGRVGSANLPL